ncbi:ATP-binding protein [Niveibacterium sp. 24ML]|uniref:ATP-binding protein n=1 Tax=Niveibacterium sp. 24ML TaxID=2985512 RepID=UPI0022722CC8|nr:ATP-binding protein [Niveibacterium sp. 24ML]MCX9156778.1 ATP-binding protein [Niveibacterium sp. 24ML]
MKLQGRLIRVSIGVLLLGLALHLALLVGYEQLTYRDRILQDLRGRAQILGLNSAAAISFNDARAARENLQTLRAAPAVTLACLYNEQRALLAQYGAGQAPCPAQPDAAQRAGLMRHIEPIRVQNETVGAILLEERLPSLSERLPRYGLTLLSSIGVETLLVLVLAVALRSRVVQPVQQLAELAARVTEKRDYAQRAMVLGKDEIGALSEAFNRMLAAIQEREAALEDGARLLQALIDHAPATITMKGIDGRYLLANQQFAQLAGRSGKAIIGQRDEDLFEVPVAASRENLDRAAGESEAGLRSEEQLGGRVWLCERFPLRNAANEIYAVSAISTDITEQLETQASLAQALARVTELNETLEARVTQRGAELKQAMAQLVHSEKLAALGSLVAGIAHELNTPVGMVVTTSSTMADRARDFEKLVAENRVSRSGFKDFLDDLRDGMRLIENNSLRAGRLINDFKQVAVDQTSMRRREFALDELVRNTLHALGPMFRHAAHRIEANIDARIDCNSYPGALEQIMTNLIQNALVHGFKDRDSGLITVSASESDGIVTLRLCDNGSGIDAQHLPHLFDPFFTTRLGEGGSGLGLYIVHNLASGILGGKIEVSCPPEGGACFTLSFPACAPPRERMLD